LENGGNSMAKKTIIIGGVAGGATTAARLRRRDGNMEIVMFEKGDYISFANCGLPYYIGDVIKSREALLLQTPQSMSKKFHIDIRVKTEVISIDPDAKKVTAKNLATGEEYEETYDYLVIATGSSPLKPPIKGIEGAGIFSLWNIPDMDRIKAFMEEKKPKHAVVVGGGFIGLEMAENLHHAGMKVSLVEMQKQVMTNIDYEMAQLLHENMRLNDVSLYLEDGVKEFESLENGGTRIHLSSQNTIEADLVILSIGIRPNSELARAAKLVINERGGIVVNEYLETSLPDIYAVGDVIEVNHLITKDRTMIPLAGPANKQARICADNIAGDRQAYRGTLGTSVAKVFDFSVASVGVNEKMLFERGLIKGEDYEVVLINQKSHAGYYPGATTLNLKVIFEVSGRLLGAQIVGQDGVDKRIDTIATVMAMGGSIFDLTRLELAYAPPFSSAKDPVNMAGFVGENVLYKLVSFVTAQELDEIRASNRKDYIILDVTEEMERMVFSIPDSYHIPLGQLLERMQELDLAKEIIVYCAIGVRSYNAARTLMQNGFGSVKVLAGGTSFYKSLHHMTHKKIEPVLDIPPVSHTSGGVISNKELIVLDCCGLQCPGPIMRVHESICTMQEGEVLQVKATDMGFTSDIEAWCRRTGNTLVKKEKNDKEYIVYIQKGLETCDVSEKTEHKDLPQGKTLVVFSGDMDKVLASFIIANGARSLGRPVTMFFTFWGLNALRKSEKVPVKKPIIDSMFGFMMPRGARKLKISKMNMGGMGTVMMKKVMKDKNVDSLEELMKKAMESGIKLVACTMSMDVMGITKEELIDGIEYAGVASYLGDAEESNVNLFI